MADVLAQTVTVVVARSAKADDEDVLMCDLCDVMLRHNIDIDQDLRGQDDRFVSTTVGNGNEFKVAVLSCHAAHPELPMYLLTNVRYLDPVIRALLHKVFEVDLMSDSGLDEVYGATGDNKFGFGTKAQSLITGWGLDILPEKVR